MYKRKEVIEEEHLDWNVPSQDENINKYQEVPSVPIPKTKSNLSTDKNFVEDIPEKQNKLMDLLYKYEYLSLGMILIILPYLVGFFFNFILFYVYSGISLAEVFNIDTNHNVFELWTIGAYTFATIWIIWILLKTLTDKR